MVGQVDVNQLTPLEKSFDISLDAYRLGRLALLLVLIGYSSR